MARERALPKPPPRPLSPPADPASLDRAGAKDADGVVRCELCGHACVLERHCKIVCRNCGFVRDCSDP